MWNLLPLSVFSSDTFSSFKSDMNLCLLRALLDFLSLYQFLFAALQFAWHHGSGTVLVYRGIPFSSSMCQVVLIIIIT